ncbi:hypothetical protein QUF54_04920 [Candidatus Marithioploca araucensis]|uniref:Uncharacterized protein n=1 Tax=Candidatus Marithioploca araucensis TaxID=70273 RepID=A0ABT7VSY4_9GAMM|nr:hypothetical protein [Candidatus Marithioploca araucensis]
MHPLKLMSTRVRRIDDINELAQLNFLFYSFISQFRCTGYLLNNQSDKL